MGTFFSGKGGSVAHNSVTYCAKSWSLDLDDSIVDVTNMTSGGWKEFISGIRGAQFSYELVFDPTLAALTPGQTLTNLTLGINSSYKVTISSGIVSKVRPSTSTEGAAMLSINGSATGVVNTTFS